MSDPRILYLLIGILLLRVVLVPRKDRSPRDKVRRTLRTAPHKYHFRIGRRHKDYFPLGSRIFHSLLDRIRRILRIVLRRLRSHRSIGHLREGCPDHQHYNHRKDNLNNRNLYSLNHRNSRKYSCQAPSDHQKNKQHTQENLHILKTKVR